MVRDFQDSRDTIYAMPPDAVPHMKAVYDEETGGISHIYYADKNEPSGYSLHGDERFVQQNTEKTQTVYQNTKHILKGVFPKTFPFLS